MLEDESGRLRLIGTPLTSETLVTGCIVAVMGTENANGDFEVVDVKVPELPAQPERYAATDIDEAGKKVKKETDAADGDTDMSGGQDNTPRKKIAIVSGLSFSGTATDNSLQLALLSDYLSGQAFGPNTQREASQISRLIIAGNSIASTLDAIPTEPAVGNTRKTQKKYGYDSSAYNPLPIAHLDDFLADLLPSIPITLLPGANDPANVSLPQQPIHGAMFPQARAYSADPDAMEPAWFDSVTNPWQGQVEGWHVLATGGQNVDDVFKYIEGDDRVGIMEGMCRWRCCAPTAPDTLCTHRSHPLPPALANAQDQGATHSRKTIRSC